MSSCIFILGLWRCYQSAQPLDNRQPDRQRKTVLRAFRIAGLAVHGPPVDEISDDLHGVEMAKQVLIQFAAQRRDDA